MEIIYDTETECNIIKTGVRSIDSNDGLDIYSADGYGGADICIFHECLTWKELDVIKDAIEYAEKNWRPEKERRIIGGKVSEI